MPTLAVHVRLHDGRYHGEGDWPPSPARLFQALVAGAGLGGPLGDPVKEALRWLECRKPPLIAAPLARQPRRGVCFFMPNNDSDAIGGDPRKLAKIRTATKVFRPYFFDAAVPFVYAWSFSAAEDDGDRARTICSLAERLYQFGRGIDLAWAWGEILDDRELDHLLARHPGRVFRPSAGRSPMTLPSPCRGSLESIERRHRACGGRFRYVKVGRSVRVDFRNPPRPQFQAVPYDSPTSLQLYELQNPDGSRAFAPWPLERASALVVRLRDGATERLGSTLPARKAEIERVLVGRKPDGTNDGPTEERVRIVPLPSIGHVHADRQIRRVLVEVPPTCPLRPDDVRWTFSGLEVEDGERGETVAVLTPADGERFLRHYGLRGGELHLVWRTVTPAALPEEARRRRIDPACKGEQTKDGRERAREQARAAAAVLQALRHAGIRTSVETVRVQREPFEAKGARVEAFAEKTRFPKEQLWHVELTFGAPIPGPLVIGNGRFLGLGIMAPVVTTVDVYVFAIEAGLSRAAKPDRVARALRRAVMARVQDVLGKQALPTFFSGHESNGTPARAPGSSHLAFTYDPHGSRLLVVAPHALDRRRPTRAEKRHLRILDEALEGMEEIRAGAAGLLRLRRISIGLDDDVLTMPSRVWESATAYVVTRHVRAGRAVNALTDDLRAECQRRLLPKPLKISVLQTKGIPRIGLSGRCRLEFRTAVRGPIILGRNRHVGGGLFLAKQE